MLQRRIPTITSRGGFQQTNIIPPTFVQEVRERSSIRGVIESYVKLKKTGASLVGLCPFHSEKSPSFSVSEEKGFYHCFGCGEHGDAIEFLMKFAGQTFREAVEELAGTVGMQLPQASAARPMENYTEIYNRLNLANNFFRHCLKHTDAPKEYLKSRGVLSETLKTFPISYAPPGWQSLEEAFGNQVYANDRDIVQAALVKEKDGRRYDVFRDRLMFAIKDTRGRIIGFGGRSLDGSTPKYLNSPESPVFDKSSILFGFHEARSAIRAEKKVIVVEGYMDVVILAQSGIKAVVATMGTACTPQQIERLCANAEVIIFTFDGDEAGQRAAWRALENCLPYVTEKREFRFCLLPQGKDPDDIVTKEGPQVMNKILDGAQGLTQFFVSELAKKHNNLDSPEDKARFLAKGLEMVARLPKGSAYSRTIRHEVGKASQAGAAYIATMRQLHRKTSTKSDVWERLVESIRRFPCAARDQVSIVVDGLSEGSYELLEDENFSGEHERMFWEEFLALPDLHRPKDEPAVSAEDQVRWDVISSIGSIVNGQLKKQQRSRINNQYRKGELDEAEFIAARSGSPSPSQEMSG